MAEENDVLEEGGEQQTAPEQQEQQEAQAPEQPEEQPQPDPIAQVATKMGWVPKEQFRGDPETWKPAEQFILDGKDIQRNQSKTLRELHSTVEHIARTNAAILQERIEEERNRLAGEFSRAVEEGDSERAWRISEQAKQIEQKVPSAQPSIEAAEWVERNPWFKADPLANQRAVQVAETYARAGKTASEQLQAAEDTIRREYPHLFANGHAPSKPAPTVSAPAARSAVPSNRPRTFADMPKAAQDIAKDMADRGVIPSVDVYARNWWASEGKAAR